MLPENYTHIYQHINYLEVIDKLAVDPAAGIAFDSGVGASVAAFGVARVVWEQAFFASEWVFGEARPGADPVVMYTTCRGRQMAEQVQLMPLTRPMSGMFSF